jgi:cell division protein FtsB
MIEFNEAETTNLYLIDQLVIARKENEVLKEEIATLIEHIKTLQEDLKMSSQLLNACVAYMS